MRRFLIIILISQFSFKANSQAFEEKQVAGNWKLEKLSYPKMTFDLSNKEMSFQNFLKGRRQFSTPKDSLDDIKSYEEMMSSLQTIYLFLNTDSSFETNMFDEGQTIDKGRYIISKDKRIAFFPANKKSYNIELEVIFISKEALVISAKQQKEDDAPTFSFKRRK